MLDIKQVKLIDVLPPNLRADPDVIAASASIDNRFSSVLGEVLNCIIYPRIDELDSDLINLLAWQFHVDFYDTNLPLERRRELVKNSYDWHRRKGTPGAVEEMVSATFADSTVSEWFEHNGQPYTFRINTKEKITDEAKFNQLIEAIDSVRNTRSWLDKLTTKREENASMCVGLISVLKKQTTINYIPKFNINNAYINIGAISTNKKLVKIKPYLKIGINNAILNYGSILKNNKIITLKPKQQITINNSNIFVSVAIRITKFKTIKTGVI